MLRFHVQKGKWAPKSSADEPAAAGTLMSNNWKNGRVLLTVINRVLIIFI